MGRLNSIKSVLIFITILIASILYTYFNFFKVEEQLPIYQPSDINPALVDSALFEEMDHRISDFTLVNHLGDTISLADVKDQILVVDFFFTRCATICPLLTSNLKLLHDRVSDDIRIISHSVTPVADSVSVLHAYAEKHAANEEIWWFVTGEKSEIYRLARKSYFACLDEGDGGYQDFVHTENVVLVDREGRLRGFYDGTLQEEISQLYRDIQLLREEK